MLFLPNKDSGYGSGDDEDDCPDGSYLCSRSAMCILETSLCDGVNDCDDWEDESVSVCGGKWFMPDNNKLFSDQLAMLKLLQILLTAIIIKYNSNVLDSWDW